MCLGRMRILTLVLRDMCLAAHPLLVSLAQMARKTPRRTNEANHVSFHSPILRVATGGVTAEEQDLRT